MTPGSLFRIGLTGNVASGKSTVADVWKELGAAVVDADELARRAVAPGTPGLERVRATFGADVMAGDELDRSALGRQVFGDASARARLEAIVHPEVARLRELEEAKLLERGVSLVVHDVPLLFEVELEDEFDLIVLVEAPEELRAERLVRDRGLSPAEARDRIAAQMPAAAKRGRADIVIDNAGTRDAVRREAESVWRDVLDRAGGVASSQRTIRMDLHLHTRVSWDCRSDPEEVLERALEAGLHRICVTDHNEVEAGLELAARYPDRVIPGEEVKTAEGVDVIGLFLSEWIPKGTPARETCERIREQGGIVYVPHPFAGGKGGGGRILPEIEDLVHAVEGFNARLHDPALNDRAREWGEARGLPLGAGSDAHTLGEVGNAWVELPEFELEPDAFLSALERGTLHGREASRLVHIASTIAKFLP